ncbi:hypothetical protein GCM10028801_37360 [Nocardioides maradonensis]
MIEAHGFGGQADLPIPLGLAISGAVAALVLSFAVLILAWRSPRYVIPGGRPASALLDRIAGSAASLVVLRTLGIIGLLYCVATALWGQPYTTNPFMGIFFVWLWVGVPAAALLFGPVWRALNPMRTITAGLTRLSGGDPRQGMLAYPEWLGNWPAALGLFAFVWQELVSSNPTDLNSLRLWCAVYGGAMLVGGMLFGQRWFARADPFEVYSTAMAHLSVWAKQDGRLVVRSPLANLATLPARPGLVAVVAVLFGSTAFDSFKESNRWIHMIQTSSINGNVINNLGLLGFCCGAGLVLTVACLLTPGGTTPQRLLPRQFAHTIVPIIAAYILAHYLTFLIDNGIQTLARVSDPFGKGWDILGTDSFTSNYWFSYHPTFLASMKVVAVVIGHVTAAASSHDRALVVLPRRWHVLGQLPVLLAMVGFTAGGLYLLFSA